MKLESPAFKDGEWIPVEYTCDGDDISPPLQWQQVPEDTESFALVCEDPDAENETWSHWVLYNIPPDTTQLEANIPPVAELSSEALHDALQGVNDFGDIRYGGPCPPSGVHHYVFRLFALDTMLDVEAGVTREELLNGIGPYVLAEAELMAVYGAEGDET